MVCLYLPLIYLCEIINLQAGQTSKIVVYCKLVLLVDFAISNIYLSFSEMHVVGDSRRTIRIASLDETRIFRITGLEFLDDGRLVICDHDNRTIKLFNDCLTKGQRLILHRRPWDVAMVNSSTVVVTLPHAMQLYYIHVKETLEVRYIVHVGRKCWGIAVMGDEIYITCHNNPGHGEVRVLHLNGFIKRIIKLHSRLLMLQRPNYLCVSAVTGFIFVSDFDLHTVTCLTADGRISKQCSVVENPTAVCLDRQDNIVSCGCQICKQVMVLSANHDKVKIMIGDDDILENPLSIAYRKRDNILVVGFNGDGLLVFKLAS